MSARVSVCVCQGLQCWNCVCWWERWRLLSMSHPIRRHLHVCLCERGSRWKLSVPTTARSLTLRPKSSLRQQEEHKHPPCRCYRKKCAEMVGLTDTEENGDAFPDSWSKLGVFISFQTPQVTSFITWSTAVQRSCRHRKRNWRLTSLSWRLRYTW